MTSRLAHGQVPTMRLEFFMPMVPPTLTHQAKELAVTRSGKPIMHDSAELKAVKAKLAAHLAGHVPDRPFSGAVRLVHAWYWPCADTSHDAGSWRITKPDTDNIAKSLKDCMETVGFFETGDQQVAEETIRKFWADVPGIYVLIEEL